MRAHEKMLLNSKLMRAEPYSRHVGRGVGCALGMMEGPEIESWAEVSAEELYPWLLNPVEKPCECALNWDFYPTSITGTGIHAVTHLFNEHVCGGVACESWTMERLANYIKSIDPTVDQDEELICEEGVNVEVKA